MSTNAPIGVFDSGIGGLTVVKELMEIMPGEDLIYFGDTARAPYGSRSPLQIIEFMQQILHFFEVQKVKMAVVACNAMTTVGLEVVRQHYPFLMVGVNNASESALRLSHDKKIGVIATVAAIESGKHAKAIQGKDKDAKVYPQACPKFVPLIENGIIEGEEMERAVDEYLMPMKEAGIDAVILACTHYPFVRSMIQKVVGSGVEIIDPAKETAMDAYKLLSDKGKLSTQKQGKVRLCFSADVQRAKNMAGLMFDTSQVGFELVDLEKFGSL